MVHGHVGDTGSDFGQLKGQKFLARDHEKTGFKVFCSGSRGGWWFKDFGVWNQCCKGACYNVPYDDFKVDSMEMRVLSYD